MNPLIDTHAHLYLAEYDTDRDEMLQRAQEAGVQRIFLPAIDSSTHDAMISLENAHSFCQAMMGVHPC